LKASNKRDVKNKGSAISDPAFFFSHLSGTH
jgi:hypothetical protein